MSVLDEEPELLTDFEMLDLVEAHNRRLEERFQGGSQNTVKELVRLKIIEYAWLLQQIRQHLYNSPSCYQHADAIQYFMDHISVLKKRLTPQEVLQILNLRPSTMVELHTIIANASTRYTDEELEQILTLVLESLPVQEVQVEAEEHEE